MTPTVKRNVVVAWHDLIEAFGPRHVSIGTTCVGIIVLLLAAQRVVPIRAVAWLLYLAVAVTGLNFIMALGNMASIGHGAFVATGALVTTLLRSGAGMAFIPSVGLATAATAVAAFVVGHGAIHLRAVQLAVASWLGAWLMTSFLASFPGVSGGAAGIVVAEATVGRTFGLTWRVTPTWHLLIAALLLAIVLLLFHMLANSSVGLLLITIKQNPRQAAVIGTLRDDVRLRLFVFGSTVAGLVGALGVHLSGIFDHRAFGTMLSVTLFLGVLVGRPLGRFGPAAGAAVVAMLPLGGQPLIPFASTSGAGGEALAGLLLLAMLFIGAAETRSPVGRRSRSPTRSIVGIEIVDPPRLEIRRVSKTFGGLVAVDRVDLHVDGGEIHGIMGPNGSGKSTLLALISGQLIPDSGSVLLDEGDVTALPARKRLTLGVGRSLQSSELFPDLTALEHLEAATLVDRRYAGFTRAMLRTPLARAEEAAHRQRALGLLEEFGLAGYKDSRAVEIPAGARRLLLIAMAIGGRRVILLDEPSAGMSSAEVLRTAAIILELKNRGAAIVVVEHNIRLLRRVADVITVLDGGRVIASGDPKHIYEDPQVRRAYLGLAKEDTA